MTTYYDPKSHCFVGRAHQRVRRIVWICRGGRQPWWSFKGVMVSVENKLRNCENLRAELESQEAINRWGGFETVWHNFEVATKTMMEYFDDLKEIRKTILFPRKEDVILEQLTAKIFKCYGSLNPVESVAEERRRREEAEATAERSRRHQSRPNQPCSIQRRPIPRRPVQPRSVQSQRQLDCSSDGPEELQYNRWGFEWRGSQ